jgi:hypothetical protein
MASHSSPSTAPNHSQPIHCSLLIRCLFTACPLSDSVFIHCTLTAPLTVPLTVVPYYVFTSPSTAPLLHLSCTPTISSLYPHCTLTISSLYCTLTGPSPSLYPHCTLTAPLTAPSLYRHCALIRHHTVAVPSALPSRHPPCTLPVPSLRSHCIFTVSHQSLLSLPPPKPTLVTLDLSKCWTSLLTVLTLQQPIRELVQIQHH